MIAFATLLLGLISGVYPIEVTVGGGVTAVELTLDGAPAGRIDGPPWVARVNLGSDLRPRVLTAHGLDAEGKEIARVTQWLNLPRPPAEVDIVLENGVDGTPKAAALAWQSVNGVKPASIGLTLDGQPLPVDEQGRVALPPRDLKIVHVLTAELWFPPGLLARKDVVYGGEYGSEVSTELTAVPVRVHPGASLPPLQDLQGWFAAGGQPLPVAAVEDGPGKVILVRLPSGTDILDKLIPGRLRSPALSFRNGVLQLGREDPAGSLRYEMRLGKADKVRFLSLSSSPYKNSRVPAELFDMSRELTYEDGGLFWYLTNSRVPADAGTLERRIADAVAVAGLQAAAENYRRAVVLVLGRDDADSSRYDPATVRRYLESIHVPLFVWSLYGPNTIAAKWGGAEDISTVFRLRAAVKKLRSELVSQRIVWLEGRHLPQAIALSRSAQGVDLPR